MTVSLKTTVKLVQWKNQRTTKIIMTNPLNVQYFMLICAFFGETFSVWTKVVKLHFHLKSQATSVAKK